MKNFKRELLIGIRGRRSQLVLSKRMKYTYNQVYRWESGQAEITWVDFVRYCAACSINLEDAVEQTFNFKGNVMNFSDLLSHFTGGLKRKDLYELLNCSPYRLRRWMSGIASPDLIDFLQIIDKISHQLVEFTNALRLTASIQSIQDMANIRKSHLHIHETLPFVGALLHAMELPEYSSSRALRSGWLARKIGISVQQEEDALHKLHQLGLVTIKNYRYCAQPLQLDLRNDLLTYKSKRLYWMDRGCKFLTGLKDFSARQHFGYLTFSCSKTTRLKVEKLYYKFIAEVRQTVESADDKPDSVQVLNVQFFDPKVLP